MLSEPLREMLTDYTPSGHADLHVRTIEKARFLTGLKDIAPGLLGNGRGVSACEAGEYPARGREMPAERHEPKTARGGVRVAMRRAMPTVVPTTGESSIPVGQRAAVDRDADSTRTRPLLTQPITELVAHQDHLFHSAGGP